MTLCNVKVVAHSDKPRESTPNSAVPFSSTECFQSLSAQFLFSNLQLNYFESLSLLS